MFWGFGRSFSTSEGDFYNSSSPRIRQTRIQGFPLPRDLPGLIWRSIKKVNFETEGNFLWVHHLRKFILARRSFGSWLGSLHVYFPVLRYCSLSSGPGNSASTDLRLVPWSGTLGRILTFSPKGAPVRGNPLTNLVVLWSCGCGFSSLWIRESWSGVQIQLLLRTSVLKVYTLAFWHGTGCRKIFGAYPFLHEYIFSISSLQVLLPLSWDFCMICRMLCGLFKMRQIMQQAYKKLCISSLTWTNLLTGRIATYLI